MSEPQPKPDYTSRAMSGGAIALLVVQFIWSMLANLPKPEPKPEPTPEPIPVPVVVVDWYEETADGDRIENPKASDFAGSCTEGVRYFRGYPASGKIKLLKVTVENLTSPQPTPPTPVPPKPVPPKPTPPKPDLTGLALETYEQSKGYIPSECKLLAGNYKAVSSAISAGGIVTFEQAGEKFIGLTKGKVGTHWDRFSKWSAGKLDECKTLKELAQRMDEISTGLYAAAGE